MTEAVIFEGVSKRYATGLRYATLRHDLARLWTRTRGRPTGTVALDDVSFAVPEGASFALIGPNGAGKTTALRLLCGISYPTAGRIRVRGRVGALVEVGSGLHLELTARENVDLYGRILGMGRTEVRRRLEEIVAFAELSEVADAPVKTFSTGMQLRLGFAIAAHVEPDILVVDEALAVGDAGFQAKCTQRMAALVAEGRSLILVSHDLSAVEALCPEAAFLEAGRLRCVGPTRQVLRSYFDSLDRMAGRLTPGAAAGGPLELQDVTLHAADGTSRSVFDTGDDVEIRLRVQASKPVRKPHVSVGISDGRPGNLVLCSMLVDGGAPDVLHGERVVACRLHALPLRPRVYTVWCSVRSEHAYGDLVDWQPVATFRIAERHENGPVAVTHAVTDGPVAVAHDWRVE